MVTMLLGTACFCSSRFVSFCIHSGIKEVRCSVEEGAMFVPMFSNLEHWHQSFAMHSPGEEGFKESGHGTRVSLGSPTTMEDMAIVGNCTRSPISMRHRRTPRRHRGCRVRREGQRGCSAPPQCSPLRCHIGCRCRILLRSHCSRFFRL